MSVEEWSPATPAVINIELERLEHLASLDKRGEVTQLAQVLNEKDRDWLAFVMKADRKAWEKAAAPLTDSQLVSLIKALAIAEMALPGCLVGEKSPVIHLNRLLKTRGSPLDRENLQWLKQHSTNRYLPNGPIGGL